LAAAKQRLQDDIACHEFAQWVFDRQWQELRRYAAQKGVGLIGDVPIYVSHDSADCWARQDHFNLDHEGRPLAVAGVPPDYFSATGQLWGNPLYRWDVHQDSGFSWWCARLRVCASRFDAVRLDHFIGFRNYWEIQTGETSAVNGRWVDAPGSALFKAAQREVPGLGIIAEDLGAITPAVCALRDEFSFPGMKVAQFSFDGGPQDLPENWPEHCVAYTGTHDNAVANAWYDTHGEKFAAVLGHAPKDPAWALANLVWNTRARLAMAPMQDLLSLGASARMNTPGTSEGNWGWRMEPGSLTTRLAGRLGLMTGGAHR
jgi:4-alpha-glucanotransferase